MEKVPQPLLRALLLVCHLLQRAHDCVAAGALRGAGRGRLQGKSFFVARIYRLNPLPHPNSSQRFFGRRARRPQLAAVGFVGGVHGKGRQGRLFGRLPAAARAAAGAVDASDAQLGLCRLQPVCWRARLLRRGRAHHQDSTGGAGCLWLLPDGLIEGNNYNIYIVNQSCRERPRRLNDN